MFTLACSLHRQAGSSAPQSWTNLSVKYHGPDHALGKLEAVQLGLGHLSPAVPHLDGPLDILVLSRECAITLCLVQAIVVLVTRIGKSPQMPVVVVVVGLGRISGQDNLVGGAVQTRVAGEGGTKLALAAASRHVLLDQRR